MVSTGAAIVELSVDEIAAMSDTELGHFMTKHRLPDGGYELPVNGWDKLSKDERGHLAARLKAQEQGLAQSPTAFSCPLDIDDLDARLRQVSPNKSFSLQPEPRTARSPTPLVDPTIREAEAYQELVNDGGRPLYPIDLIHNMFQHPDNYAETLRPWQVNNSPVSPSGIFQKQLQRWRNFRRWQNDHRGHEDDEGGFLAFVEWNKHITRRDMKPKCAAKHLAEIEADPSCLKSIWEHRQWERERQRRYCRERGCQGFSDYTEAVKRRLARHDFTQPCKLNEDPKNQDNLTTWIEYLNYEYWWLDKYTSDIERLEPEHDKLWQDLVDKKIPRPHETKEFVRTALSGMEGEAEKDQAMKTVQRAESEARRIYASTQEGLERSSIPIARRISMLKHSAEKVLAAKERLRQVQSRLFLITQFVRATFDYDEAKRDAARQRVLVQWVLDQVPLIQDLRKANIQLESGGKRATKRRLTSDEELGSDGQRATKRRLTSDEELGSDGRRATKRRLISDEELGSDGQRATKRRLTSDEEPLERQDLKRARIDLEEPRLASAIIPSKVTKTQSESRIVMDQEAAQGSHQDDVQAIPQGPRRSARIAAYRDASKIAPERGIPQPRRRSRSGATPAHAPAKPPPAQPLRSSSLVEDTKAHTVGRPSRGKSQRGKSQRGTAKSNRRSQRRQQRRGD
ncbi:hypothetical protein CCM_08300 [Cordyceps militaris CM01]|uniref:Ankyrin 2,3/unc44 n=1 Tax=Cordyceps militaris (strain CM01) TaxID=983644 RepID=G3JTB0_CORMM|nr:uncharacterized protein CCM_08300 [Cordyceps militaris CM01]EGX88257.1 hypothetical protein CCM_08300 [Cordyceps militaris CM01]